LGLEGFAEVGFEGVVFFLGFGWQDDAAAGESVLEAVLGRVGFALGGDLAPLSFAVCALLDMISSSDLNVPVRYWCRVLCGDKLLSLEEI
jgi:hypothetical protein